MQTSAPQAQRSTASISPAILSPSDHYVQLPTLRIEAPATPTRMSPRRLSWRRRRDPSTSSQSSAPDPYRPEVNHSALHRSMSELSPVSPVVERGTFVDEYGRRFTRTGFSRRQQSEDSSFNHQRHDYAQYRPQVHEPETAVRVGPSVITSFSQDASAPMPTHRWPTASWPVRVDSMAQSYGFQPSYMGPAAATGGAAHEGWGYESSSPSQISSQPSFMTSPTSYTGSSSAQLDGRAQTWSRISQPPGALHATYPPISAPMLRRESEQADGFTSPTDFALFAAATSSLDISPAPSPNPTTGGWFSQRPVSQYVGGTYASATPYPHQQQLGVMSSRLNAPLPPVPHHRSRSSPAPTAVRRQPSHQELVAEALAGLDIADRIGSDDDDDELPNYEQSQAEVAAAKRREAAARAQELDEAWTRARQSNT